MGHYVGVAGSTPAQTKTHARRPLRGRDQLRRHRSDCHPRGAVITGFSSTARSGPRPTQHADLEWVLDHQYSTLAQPGGKSIPEFLRCLTAITGPHVV